MKLSCTDYTFALLDHENALDLIHMLGFDAVDIGLWGAITHLRAGEVLSDPIGSARRLDRQVRERELSVADVFMIPDPDYAVMAVNNPSSEERGRGREMFVELTRFAAALGAPGVTLIPGLDFEGESHDDSLALAASELSARVALARDVGLRVSVEPHIGSVIGTPADTLRLLELAPELEITLDHSHFVMQGFATEDLDPLLPRVRHVHTRGAMLDRLQVGMKDNVIDYERVVGVLRSGGYSGHLTTEYLWIDQGRCDECDTLSETILMRDRLRASLAAAAS